MPNKETGVNSDIFQPDCRNSVGACPQSIDHCACHTYFMLGIRKSRVAGAEKLNRKLGITRISIVFLWNSLIHSYKCPKGKVNMFGSMTVIDIAAERAGW